VRCYICKQPIRCGCTDDSENTRLKKELDMWVDTMRPFVNGYEVTPETVANSFIKLVHRSD